MHILPRSDVLLQFANWPIHGWDPLPMAGQAWAPQLASVALTALWQGALVACGLAVCLRLAPATSAAHRFLLWFAGFSALVRPLGLTITYPGDSGGGVHLPAIAPFAATGPLAAARSSLEPADCRALAGSHRLARRKSAYPPFSVAQAVQERHAPDARSFRRCCRFAHAPAGRSLHHFSFAAALRHRLFRAAHPHSRLALPPAHAAGARADSAPRSRASAPPRRLDEPSAEALPDCFPAESRPACGSNAAFARSGRWLATTGWCRHARPARLCRVPGRLAECAEYRAEALSLGIWQRRPELVRRVQSLLMRTRPAGPLATFATLAVLACGLVAGFVELARCPRLIAFLPTARPALQIASALSRPHPEAMALAAHAPQLRVAGVTSAHTEVHPASGTDSAAPFAASSPLRPSPVNPSLREVLPEVPEHPVLVLRPLSSSGFRLRRFRSSPTSNGPRAAPEWASADRSSHPWPSDHHPAHRADSAFSLRFRPSRCRPQPGRLAGLPTLNTNFNPL